MRRFVLTAAAAAALAGCQSTGGSGGAMDTATLNTAHNLAAGLADAIGRCWFAPGETMLEGYIYTPENVAGRPRILLASKSDPTGLPALVIEPVSGSDVNVYGPLATGTLGPRLTADLDRWRTGGTACGS